MRTQPCRWGNPETGEIFYGIKVKVNGKWSYAAEGGKPLLFKTEVARDAKRRELSKIRL